MITKKKTLKLIELLEHGFNVVFEDRVTFDVEFARLQNSLSNINIEKDIDETHNLDTDYVLTYNAAKNCLYACDIDSSLVPASINYIAFSTMELYVMNMSWDDLVVKGVVPMKTDKYKTTWYKVGSDYIIYNKEGTQIRDIKLRSVDLPVTVIDLSERKVYRLEEYTMFSTPLLLDILEDGTKIYSDGNDYTMKTSTGTSLKIPFLFDSKHYDEIFNKIIASQIMRAFENLPKSIKWDLNNKEELIRERLHSILDYEIERITGGK